MSRVSSPTRYVSRTKSGRRRLAQNLWTGEVVDDQPILAWDPLAGDLRLSYEDPRDDDWEDGVLWLRHRQDRTGDFRWKAVNTPRTRRMMREHLCMICDGSCVRKKDSRIWWLFHQEPEVVDGVPVTNLLPTCPDCIPEALETCPHLAEWSRIVTVAATIPFAVTADLYGPGEGDPSPAVKKAHEVVIPYRADTTYWLRWALGKQPWVALHDMRDEQIGTRRDLRK